MHSKLINCRSYCEKPLQTLSDHFLKLSSDERSVLEDGFVMIFIDNELTAMDGDAHEV